MEALGLPSRGPLTISQSATSRRVRTARSSRTKTHSRVFMELPPLGLISSLAIRHKKRSVIRMIADTDDYDLRQMMDKAAARKRWDSLIREQKVKCLTPREAGYAIQLLDKTLLDVRSSVESSKASGWWSGAPTLSYNKQFLSNIEEKFPKDLDLIVACQKGLRSLAACELLYNAGYRNLFWVQGGLEASEEEDLPREGPQPLKFAGIGELGSRLFFYYTGHSYSFPLLPILSWTDQQRAAAAKEGWAYRLVFSARLVILLFDRFVKRLISGCYILVYVGLFLVADALFLGVQQLGRYLQELRTH
ncbi:hypothetical protein ACJRO7_009342 [Eucalyptus globulus]|uniref:Rhodanese domain-containing protein n=1 Tax=Eucalyptus globulus TaxID=34317 RepID=A0ABD3L8D1_EUCGL